MGMSDAQEQVWLGKDYAYTFEVTQELLDDQDVFEAIDRSTLAKAEREFRDRHPDMDVRLVQLRKSKHVTQEFDPATFAPYEEPRHYYVVYIRVHYTPIDSR